MTSDVNIERPSTKWEDIVGNERDSKDINAMEAEYGAMTSMSEDRRFPPGSGLILRQGGQPRGYILLEVYDRRHGSGTEPALLIKHFYVSREVRGIGSFKRIIQMFREQAERRACKSVMWEPVTLMELQLTKRMGAKREGRYYVMPVEDLDMDVILSRL